MNLVERLKGSRVPYARPKPNNYRYLQNKNYNLTIIFHGALIIKFRPLLLLIILSGSFGTIQKCLFKKI